MKQSWDIKKLRDVIVENRKSTLKSKGNFEGDFPFFISGKTIKTINISIIDGDNIYLPTGGNFYIHYYSGKASYSTDTWSLRTNSSADIKYFFSNYRQMVHAQNHIYHLISFSPNFSYQF